MKHGPGRIHDEHGFRLLKQGVIGVSDAAPIANGIERVEDNAYCPEHALGIALSCRPCLQSGVKLDERLQELRG